MNVAAMGLLRIVSIKVNNTVVPIIIRIVEIPGKNSYTYIGELHHPIYISRKGFFQRHGQRFKILEASAEGCSKKEVTERMRQVIRRGLKRKRPGYECFEKTCARFVQM